jgi:hypothetical protein
MERPKELHIMLSAADVGRLDAFRDRVCGHFGHSMTQSEVFRALLLVAVRNVGRILAPAFAAGHSIPHRPATADHAAQARFVAALADAFEKGIQSGHRHIGDQQAEEA